MQTAQTFVESIHDDLHCANRGCELKLSRLLWLLGVAGGPRTATVTWLSSARSPQQQTGRRERVKWRKDDLIKFAPWPRSGLDMSLCAVPAKAQITTKGHGVTQVCRNADCDGNDTACVRSTRRVVHLAIVQARLLLLIMAPILETLVLAAGFGDAMIHTAHIT